MTFARFALAALLTSTPALAQDTREMGAHEHGVGQVNIAFEGNQVALSLTAPGADIVGFEYEAKTDADKAAIDAALDTLRQPSALFVFPEAAGCTVVEASAELEMEGEHGDDHDHDHGEEHAEHGHDDHDHGEEKHADHDGHDHDKHGDEAHAHDDHDHDHDHAASHSEFHAEAMLTCETPDALDRVTFTYFETFSNALELEVQMITSSGARAFEVERELPTLNLQGLL
ncbi:MAG: DUF2796 domain-containing protein [Pseudomonadota bacterium]